ncbi:MAG: DUF6786 family protein [Prevotella sp.]|jgi:hypothetical protein
MNKYILLTCSLLIGLTACNKQKQIKMGTYAYDAQFLNDHGIQYVELKSSDGNSKVMIVPSWQGRVLTTSAAGDNGDSYGWINYRFIESGKQSDAFNPVGGEERIWLGPEGGPYSLYFKNGKEQVYENWEVPSFIDTEAYEVVEQNDTSIHFKKSASITNTMGTVFDMDIDRTVSLLSKSVAEQRLNIKLPAKAKLVAYQSLNKITNTGKETWTKDKGLVSIWMLAQFNPTPTTTVFIPP